MRSKIFVDLKKLLRFCVPLSCNSQLSSATQGKLVVMASTISTLPPSLYFLGKRTLLRNFQKSPVFSLPERHRCISVVAKAAGENSNSSTSLSIVKSVRTAWDKSEDRLGLVGLGFAAVVAFWASTNLIGAIDKLPLIPNLLEFIGILFSWWFIYRYLLFKPDREELSKSIKSSISDILGQ